MNGNIFITENKRNIKRIANNSKIFKVSKFHKTIEKLLEKLLVKIFIAWTCKNINFFSNFIPKIVETFDFFFILVSKIINNMKLIFCTRIGIEVKNRKNE